MLKHAIPTSASLYMLAWAGLEFEGSFWQGARAGGAGGGRGDLLHGAPAAGPAACKFNVPPQRLPRPGADAPLRAAPPAPPVLAARQLGYLKQAVEWGATYLSSSVLPGDRFVGAIGDKRIEDQFW